MSFNQIAYAPSYQGAINRLRQGLLAIEDDSQVKQEILAWFSYLEA